MPSAPPSRPVRIVCVGAGPAAVMLLERIVANRERLTPGIRLDVRLVDPHRPGGGRIWRRDQSPLLKLNSMLEDVAFFTDSSCRIDGPVVPGPSLAEWVREVRRGEIARPEWSDAALDREIDEITERDFPTRRLNNAYLSWALEETRRRGGDAVRVEWHEDVAVSVEDADPDPAAPPRHHAAARGPHESNRIAAARDPRRRDSAGIAGSGPSPASHRVILGSGAVLEADIVVYALGHNGTHPSAESLRLAEFAGRHGLDYVAPAFTADIDLEWVPAGADVLVRGMGLAAVDLVVLLTEGRGGRFVRVGEGGGDGGEGDGDGGASAGGGALRYLPSGREPVLHLGSRRGVPYRSKITSRMAGDPVALEYLGREFHAGLEDRRGLLDFERDVWPLIAAELVTGYYRELCTGHPERITGDWADFAERLRGALRGGRGIASHELAELVRERVPDPDDRFDLDGFDRPLAFPEPGAVPETGASAEPAAESRAVHERVRRHIARDLRHRTSQRHSATLGLFMTALHVYFSLAEVPPERWNARARTHELPRRWHTYFSYLASGPPGHRLEEMLALAEAGTVRFLGGDLELVADEAAGAFRASGSVRTADGTARADAVARTLIDAWLPEASAAQSDNPLLRRLVATGRVRELTVADGDGDGDGDGDWAGAALTTGQIEAAPDGGLPGRPGEFALGPFVAGPGGGAFTRPGIDSLPFRIHDRCARAILEFAAGTGIGTGIGTDEESRRAAVRKGDPEPDPEPLLQTALG